LPAFLALAKLSSLARVFWGSPTYFSYFPFFLTQRIIDLLNRKKVITFLDVGSYKGDTIAFLSLLLPSVKKRVVALEPVIEHLKDINKIVEYFKEINNLETLIIPSAAWSENTFLSFKVAGMSSHISQSGDIIVPAVRMDDIIHLSSVDYIKIDVEGADFQALKGMTQIIKENKPFLAVSIYHKPEHLWQIPLYIKENFPFYKKFILEVYGYLYSEIILYCLP
jgi:FkbM family methyltransferase